MAIDLSSDFAGWLGSPIKRYKGTDANGLIVPNFNGAQDSYTDVLKNFATRLGKASGVRTAGGVGSSAAPQFKLLSLSKDPAQQGQLDNALTNLGRRSSTNGEALGRFNSVLSDNATANAGDIGQESNAVNDVFTGKLGDSLRAATDAYKSGADATNAANASALKAIRDQYGVDQSGAIKLLYANLGKSTDQYKNDTLTDIGTEVARRNADAKNFGATARVSTDQSIADATRENKAQFGQEGGGGSSYASRLGMAQRIRANTALSQALAELRMTNTEKELARHAELTDHLATLNRGDIAGEGQAGLNLGSDLNAQDYRNLGATTSRRQSLEDTVGSRDLAAIQYDQAQKDALLGARAGLRRSAANDLLSGVTANQAFDSNEIRNLGAIGEVRRANQFLGIDDGTGDSLRSPRIPNFNRRGNGGFGGNGGGYFDVQPDGSTVPGGTSAGGKAPMDGENLAIAKYKQMTGVDPYSDPNFSPQLMDYLRFGPTDQRGATQDPYPLQPAERYDGSYPSDYLQDNYFTTPAQQYQLDERTFSTD